MILDQQYPSPYTVKRPFTCQIVKDQKSEEAKEGEGDKARERVRKEESRLKRETTQGRTHEHSVLINVFLH